MRRLRLLPPLLSLLALLAGGPLRAQDPGASLQQFVAGVARLWQSGDAAGITALAADDDRIVLDLGDGRSEAVEARHVAAALRELFRDRSMLSVRPAQVTLAGGEPMRGFGELSWAWRARGVSDAESATVYVGAVRAGGGWKIRELRILR
jgi:hypothetical protein